MKPQFIVALLSFIAVGWVGGIVYIGSAPSSSSQESEPAAETSVSVSTNGVAPRKVAVNLTPGSTAKTPPFTWSQVESEDYQQFIKNLRALGCPEQTIRDMILADVNKLYAAREKPLKSRPGTLADTGEDVSAAELERRRQLREIQMEKRAVIKELLGIDLPLDLMPSEGSRAYDAFEIAFSFLPQEKRDAVQMLQENYWQQSDALKKAAKDQKSPEFVAQNKQLNDMLREELKKILNPEELENYDLRTSPTAKKLATQLAATFGPNEEEFRQIFRATQAREERLAKLPELPVVNRQATPEERQLVNQQRQALNKERTAVNTELNEQLKTSMGEERYTQYERSQDANYELLTRLGTRYGLDGETVQKAYEFQKSFKAQPPEGAQPSGGGRGQSAAAPRVSTADSARQFHEQLLPIIGETASRGYRRVRPNGPTGN